MNSSRSWGGLAALVAAGAASTGLGCGTLLGLDEFTDAAGGATGASTSTTSSTGDATTSTSDATSTGSGGDGAGGSSAETTGSTGGGGSGGAGGVGGGGGEGGGGVTYECDAGDPFEVFSSFELSSQEVRDEQVAVATRPGDNRVHVGIVARDPGNGGSQVFARTIRVGAVPDLRQIVTHPQTADNLHRQIVGGYVTPGFVHFWGQEGDVAGEFVGAANDDLGSPLTFQPYPAPQGCTRVEALAVHQDGAEVTRFAATCMNPNNQAFLYGGTVDTLEFVIGPVAAEGGNPPDELAVRAIGRAGGRYILFTGPDGFEANVGGFLRVGANQQELTQFQPITPPEGQGMFLVAGPEIDGRLFIAALHADPTFVGGGQGEGHYRTGTIVPGDAGAIVDDVTALLDDSITFANIAEVAPFFFLQRSGDLVVSAAPTLDPVNPNEVALGVWDLEGRVLVDRFRVMEANEGIAFLGAGVAAAGFGTQAVVWSEQVGGAYRVRAAGVQCLPAE